jgi:aspartate racemase
VARSLAERHGLSTLVLGCTEIPLALSAVPGRNAMDLVDPAALLARALAQRAYAVAA